MHAARRRLRNFGLPLLLLIPLALSVPAGLPAQSVMPAAGEFHVNGELERYLRALQVAGIGSAYPWSIRSLSPAEVSRVLPADAAHPWASRYDFASVQPGGLHLSAVRPEVRLLYNSAFPHGSNDGPVWAGRGLTGTVRAGVAARAGPLSLTLAPVAFRTQNADFALASNGHGDHLAFADPRNPILIDLPQRFGDNPYGRIDPGQSSLRLDLPLVAAGVSTANQHWGPAQYQPFLLGSNAPGYLHGFVGTSAPVDLWVGHLHGRMVWGRLEQSAYTRNTGPGARRFMSGAVALFQPRWLDGLEMGGGRFFHIPWREGGPTTGDFLRPVEALFKVTRGARGGADGLSTPDNQLASVFARWVFPRNGFEAYGEYARNDHSYDLRDFLMEPDHDAGFMLGLQKAWAAAEGTGITTLRAEVLNAQVTHIVDVRHQVPFYRHSSTRQGHTHRGQILGAPAGYGAAAAAVAVDRYRPWGRWGVRWERELRDDQPAAGASALPMYDVLHSLGADALVHRGRFDVTGGITLTRNFNRNFASDVTNVQATVGVRAGF